MSTVAAFSLCVACVCNFKKQTAFCNQPPFAIGQSYTSKYITKILINYCSGPKDANFFQKIRVKCLGYAKSTTESTAIGETTSCDCAFPWWQSILTGLVTLVLGIGLCFVCSLTYAKVTRNHHLGGKKWVYSKGPESMDGEGELVEVKESRVAGKGEGAPGVCETNVHAIEL